MNRVQELRSEITMLSGILRGIVSGKYVLSRAGFKYLTRHLRTLREEAAMLEEEELLRIKNQSDNN